MNLIIHADDFGMTRSINEAILELAKLGTLSSTSVMANMPYSNEVIELLDIPAISIGLHSTFTQGKPLSDLKKIPSLIDTQGNFLDYHNLVKGYRKNSIKTDEIFIELENQFLWLQNQIGDKLIFIDSHHSIHNKLDGFANFSSREVQREFG